MPGATTRREGRRSLSCTVIDNLDVLGTGPTSALADCRNLVEDGFLDLGKAGLAIACHPDSCLLAARLDMISPALITSLDTMPMKLKVEQHDFFIEC